MSTSIDLWGIENCKRVSGQAGFSLPPNTFRMLFPVWIKKKNLGRCGYSVSQPVLAESLLCARRGPRDSELKGQRCYPPPGDSQPSGSQWRENVTGLGGRCAQATRRGQGGKGKV